MDLNGYYASLSAEMMAVKDRVRQLIGPAHWPSDGEHKETILRQAIRRIAPRNMVVGKGFIVSPEFTSTQIDVLVYDDRYPVHYQDGDLFMIPPAACRAVIEVKSALHNIGQFQATAAKQIAIQRGAVAVGIAGSDEKCAFVRELGFSACVNYKSADFLPTLAAALPDGADIYHDNVGGQMLANAFTVLKNYGTVILCGLMERYNDPARSKPLDLALPIVKRAVMKGLVVTDFEDRRAQFVDFVAPRIADGQIRYREDRATGIAATGAHFSRLMRGENLGKSIVVLGDEVTPAGAV